MALVAADSSGNGHHLAYSSDDPTLIEQCIESDFDAGGIRGPGLAMQVRTAGHNVADPAASDWAHHDTFTIRVVFRARSSNRAGPLGGLWGADPASRWYFAPASAGSAQLNFHHPSIDGGFLFCGSVPINSWNLVTVGVSPTASFGKLNAGSTVGKAPTGSVISWAGDERLRVSANPTSTFLERIDEVVFEAGHFPTTAEHEALWAAIVAGSGWNDAVLALSPTGWWKLDEGCRGGWSIGSIQI